MPYIIWPFPFPGSPGNSGMDKSLMYAWSPALRSPVPVEADADGDLFVVFRTNLVTPNDHSGVIATGGAAQIAIPDNPARQSYTIHNPSTGTLIGAIAVAEILQVKFGLSGHYIDLLPGGTISDQGTVFSGAIYVLAATTNHPFTAYEGT